MNLINGEKGIKYTRPGWSGWFKYGYLENRLTGDVICGVTFTGEYDEFDDSFEDWEEYNEPEQNMAELWRDARYAVLIGTKVTYPVESTNYDNEENIVKIGGRWRSLQEVQLFLTPLREEPAIVDFMVNVKKHKNISVKIG